MAPPRCGVENCRSRKYKEGEDGYLYCENGHRTGELIAGSDDDQFETAIRTTTRKKVDEEVQEKVYKAYTGGKAVDLYIKCLQLVLRHQLAFLIEKRGLPTELEKVVKDLWMLRILHLGNKISIESQDPISSQTFTTEESEPETEDDPPILRSRKRKLDGNPTLIDCLALCYIGSVTLRLPVTPGDIYRWTTEEDMPYTNAIRLIPAPMKIRLPSTYHNALSPDNFLNLRRFYGSVVNILIGFESTFTIIWPPLNVPVLLFRYLKDLALPLEIYDATIRLGEKLGYDFALHITPRQKFRITDLPEARLMSCLTICVKLFFPFDDVTRHPRTIREPAATRVDWAAWSRLTREARAEDRGGEHKYTTEELTRVKEKDVINMSNDQLDQYLDFYLSNFLDETHLSSEGPVDDFEAALFDMFPVASESHHRTQKLSTEMQNDKQLKYVREVNGATEEVKVIAAEGDNEIIRPGVQYMEYNENNLSDHARLFFEEAAKVAGLTTDMLVGCVRHIERQIARNQGRRKKAESFPPAA